MGCVIDMPFRKEEAYVQRVRAHVALMQQLSAARRNPAAQQTAVVVPLWREVGIAPPSSLTEKPTTATPLDDGGDDAA